MNPYPVEIDSSWDNLGSLAYAKGYGCDLTHLESIWNDLNHCLSQIRHNFSSAVILLGWDFSYPGIDWYAHKLTYRFTFIKIFSRDLNFFCPWLLLEQVNTWPTRGSRFMFHFSSWLCTAVLYCPRFEWPRSTHSRSCKFYTFSYQKLTLAHMKCSKQVYCYEKAEWDTVHCPSYRKLFQAKWSSIKKC